MARLDPRSMMTSSIEQEMDMNLQKIRSLHTEVDMLRDRQKVLVQELINRNATDG